MGEAVKAGLRKLEKFPKPVVAAINGAALGGGFEICLATNHRIAVDDGKVLIGLPESTLGLLPGGGGVTRVVRLLGLQQGLMDVLLPGHPVQARAPRRRRAWSTSSSRPARSWSRPRRRGSRPTPTSRQNPWDKPGYKMPGGTPKSPALAALPAGVPGAAAQADQGRASTRRRGRSCPPRSRARRSTSTPRRASSRAT